MDNNNELYHYGRLGMKWGQNIFGKKHSSSRSNRDGWSDDAKTASGLRKKNVKELSNQDLKKLNERVRLEQEYSRLNPSTVSKGMKVAAGIAGGLGTIAALYNNSQTLIRAGRAIADKMQKG